MKEIKCCKCGKTHKVLQFYKDDETMNLCMQCINENRYFDTETIAAKNDDIQFCFALIKVDGIIVARQLIGYYYGDVMESYNNWLLNKWLRENREVLLQELYSVSIPDFDFSSIYKGVTGVQ